jgi:hypothetical protein
MELKRVTHPYEQVFARLLVAHERIHVAYLRTAIITLLVFPRACSPA